MTYENTREARTPLFPRPKYYYFESFLEETDFPTFCRFSGSDVKTWSTRLSQNSDQGVRAGGCCCASGEGLVLGSHLDHHEQRDKTER